MRVLVVPSGIPEDYSIQMANSLLKKGIEVGIILKESTYSEFIPVISKDLLVFKIPKNVFGLLKVVFDVCRFKPDIIHFNDGVDNVSILILAVSLFFRTKIFTTFHDVIIHPGDENFKRILVRYILRKISKKIFVHGKILKGKFVDTYKIDEKDILSITIGNHNSLLFEYYSRGRELVDKDKDFLKILFFGWVAPRKGVDLLLETILELVKEGYNSLKVIVAGKLGSGFGYNELYDKIMELSKNELLKDIVEFRLRRIPWDEGGMLYKWADVVVLPYTEVSQSGIVGVAYYFSKPVIATNVGALPEIVRDGYNGLLIDGSSVSSIREGLKSSIKFLLENPQVVKELGSNARKFVETEMNWDNIVDKIIEAYYSAVK
ncbi:MAG: glycosyltransferase family 4 protein [Brevinematales bacterium]|nr:glycosyltransferase family 4 protein [Brevinematales bacterium]